MGWTRCLPFFPLEHSCPERFSGASYWLQSAMASTWAILQTIPVLNIKGMVSTVVLLGNWRKFLDHGTQPLHVSLCFLAHQTSHLLCKSAITQRHRWGHKPKGSLSLSWKLQNPEPGKRKKKTFLSGLGYFTTAMGCWQWPLGLLAFLDYLSTVASLSSTQLAHWSSSSTNI